MEFQDLENWEDAELVKRSGAAGPFAELLRRNTKALEKSARSSQKQNDIMLVFTLLLFFTGLMQLVVTLQAWEVAWYISFLVTLVILGSLYYYMKELFDLVEQQHKQ